MKKTWLTGVCAATTLLAISPLHAQEARPKLYAEWGYTQFGFSAQDDLPASYRFSSGALTGTLGYQVLPNLALEGLLGVGVDKGYLKAKRDGVSVPFTEPVRASVRNVAGVFVKPSVAVTDRIDLFARVGWVHAEHRLTVPGFGQSIDINDDSVAYGVGASFNLSRTAYIQVHWTNYFKPGGIEQSLGLYRVKTYGLNVAYGARF